MFLDLKHKQILNMSHPKPKALFFEARADHENSLSLWLSNLWATQSKQALSFSSLSSVSFFLFCFSIKLSTFILSFVPLTDSFVCLFDSHNVSVYLSSFCLSGLHVICTTLNDFYYFFSIFPPLRSRWRNSSWKRWIQTLIEYFGFSQQYIQNHKLEKN